MVPYSSYMQLPMPFPFSGSTLCRNLWESLLAFNYYLSLKSYGDFLTSYSILETKVTWVQAGELGEWKWNTEPEEKQKFLCLLRWSIIHFLERLGHCFLKETHKCFKTSSLKCYFTVWSVRIHSR